MTFVQVPVSWSSDPLAGIVVWGSGGMIAAVLAAALVGTLLGILQAWDRPLRRMPQAPQPTPGSRRRPRLAYT